MTRRQCRPVRLNQYVNHDTRLIFKVRLLFEQIRYIRQKSFTWFCATLRRGRGDATGHDRCVIGVVCCGAEMKLSAMQTAVNQHGIHTVTQNKQPATGQSTRCHQTHSLAENFTNPSSQHFHPTFNSKSVSKSSINVPPHLRHVAALPCKISMFDLTLRFNPDWKK